MNNGSKALRLFAIDSGVDRMLETPVDTEKVYEAAGPILAETTVKDDVTNELPGSWVWL